MQKHQRQYLSGREAPENTQTTRAGRYFDGARKADI